jgi:hypothetical protein
LGTADVLENKYKCRAKTFGHYKTKKETGSLCLSRDEKILRGAKDEKNSISVSRQLQVSLKESRAGY